jgi:hypothetical protein
MPARLTTMAQPQVRSLLTIVIVVILDVVLFAVSYFIFRRLIGVGDLLFELFHLTAISLLPAILLKRQGTIMRVAAVLFCVAVNFFVSLTLAIRWFVYSPPA